jgi:nucleotide-binding universal stress UspA family protein
MYKKILLGLDGSDGSFRALMAAIDLARVFGAELHSLSVEELPGYAGTVSELIEEKASANGIYTAAIEKARGNARERGIELLAHVAVGHEVKTTLEFIKANGIDLLVIGFQGHSALYERVMGSTCQSLVRLAPGSVLVVKW